MASDNLKLIVNPTTAELDFVQDISDIPEGPASSTDNAVARYDGTTGKILQNSSILANDDGTLTLGADGVTSLQAVTKQQLDAALDGVQRKTPSRVATTADITLSGTQTIDGVSVIAGDRVLVKDQTDQTENGIYEVAAGAWSRTSDADTGAELNHAIISVESGTANADKGFEQTTDTPNIGSDNIVWIQTYGVGTYTADGQGIELTGSTFSLELDGSTLSKSASGLTVAAGGITNTEVNAAAGIVYSKLSLTNSIVNADINASAAIAYSKLNLSNSIVNSDVSTSAAIALSKLAALTANRATETNGSGEIIVSSVTNTELGHLSGVTSSIQTQIDGKQTIVTVTSISSDVTIAVNTYNLVDTSAARILTLPAVSSGAVVYVKDSVGSAKSNVITIDTPGAETIDGAANLVLDSEFEFAKLVSDGTDWFRV